MCCDVLLGHDNVVVAPAQFRRCPDVVDANEQRARLPASLNATAKYNGKPERRAKTTTTTTIATAAAPGSNSTRIDKTRDSEGQRQHSHHPWKLSVTDAPPTGASTTENSMAATSAV